MLNVARPGLACVLLDLPEQRADTQWLLGVPPSRSRLAVEAALDAIARRVTPYPATDFHDVHVSDTVRAALEAVMRAAPGAPAVGLRRPAAETRTAA